MKATTAFRWNYSALVWVLPILFLLSFGSKSSEAAPMVTVWVTSTSDSGAGTLREALQNANAGDTILFSPSVFPSGTPATISITSELPAIDVNGLILDGSNAGVILTGAALPYDDNDCLIVENANNIIIRGIQFVNCRDNGIEIRNNVTNITIGGSRSTGNGPVGQGNRFAQNRHGIYSSGTNISGIVIEGNLIGTNITGNAADANSAAGITLLGVADITVGGDTTSEGNIISGNNLYGLEIWRSSNVVIKGNYIGTNSSGTATIGNADAGILLVDTDDIILQSNLISGNESTGVVVDRTTETYFDIQIVDNRIGTDISGTTAIANRVNGIQLHRVHQATITGNIVSGNEAINGWAGIHVDGGAINCQAVFRGNIIGLDENGNHALPNGMHGIYAQDVNVTIGGSTPDDRNIISGNNGSGIQIENHTTLPFSVNIEGNYIGTNNAGDTPIGNAFNGIYLLEMGDVYVDGNLISDNGENGITIDGNHLTTAEICNNYIGTDVAGTQDFGNQMNGIWSQYAELVIGDGATCSPNLISGNNGSGIAVHGDSTLTLTVRGNKIGTDITGQYPIPLGGDGVWSDGSNLVFGGPNEADRNLVSGSKQTGLTITGTISATVQNNFFGTNIDGTTIISNTWNGITLNHTQNARIFDNLSSGNQGNGIALETGAINNQIFNNYLGTDITGLHVVGDQERGIVLSGGASHNQIYDNLISGNQYGIVLHDAGTDYNDLFGNIIGMDITGLGLLSNSHTGIIVDRGAHNTIGGATPNKRNIISGNGEFGIVISHVEAIENTIAGNFIGVDGTGTNVFGNTYAGIGIFDGASFNHIGGYTDDERNIISGNLDQGINIGGYGNEVINNYIGTDPSGSLNLGNHEGVALHIPNLGTSGHNIVSGNLIVGSDNNGITIASDYNTIIGNFVGVDITGNTALGNGAHGIYVSGKHNTIGGSDAVARNVISANQYDGIAVGIDRQDGIVIRVAQDNIVQGNYIGTNALGTEALPNGWAGIFVAGVDNQIGGSQSAGQGNLVSGNNNEGIVLGEPDFTTGNQIQGNKVGTDVSGAYPIPNGDTGIALWAGVGHNTIGGDSYDLGNLVAYNHDYGIAKWGNAEQGEGVENYIAYNEIHHNDNVGLQITINTSLANNNIYENSDNRIFIPASTIQHTDQVWSVQGEADSYFIYYSCATCDLTIADDVTLTLLQGVKVYLDYNRSLVVNGQLNIRGTVFAPVRVTGPYDSIWSGEWAGIVFSPGSQGDISYADIGFAQIGLDVQGTVTLTNSTVSACKQGGIRVAGNGRLTLKDNTIGGNYKDRNQPDNIAFDISNETTTWINAQGTWWGSVDGPDLTRIQGNVDTSNWKTAEGATTSWKTAYLLNEGTHSFVISDTKDLDWYRIPITEGNRLLRVTLENPPSDYDIFLFAPLGGMSRYPNGIHARRIKHIARLMNTDETQAINQLDDIARIMFIGQYSSDNEGLDTGQLLRVSTNPGVQTDEIEFDVGNQVGWYYILVAGNNGAYSRQPYKISVTTDDKQTSNKDNYYVPVFPPLPSTYHNSTLFITNRERLIGLYGQSRVDDLFAQLNVLSANPAVNGQIIDMSNCLDLYPDWDDCNQGIDRVYAEWDANRESVYYANRVAATVKSLLSKIHTSYPDLKYIVIVGDDNVIPHWRTLDESPLAAETDYDGLVADQPIGSALAQSFFLTDDYYAQFEPITWHGRDLFLPDYALGRLVETPEEMESLIAAFLDSPTVQLNSGLITGYDFLIDQAEILSSELSALQIQQFISNTWTTNELTRTWFTSPTNFVSLNAHFSHWQAIPGSLDYGNPLLPEHILAGLSGADGSIVYSVGCHSGLNVPAGQAINGKDLDFSQVFVGKGITYIANTGYGYGDQRSVAFSERLSILFVRNLKNGLSVGEALAQAKNDYYSNTGVYSFSPYDEKSLSETILYGLPMLRVELPATQRVLDIQQAKESDPPCTLSSPSATGDLSYRQMNCEFQPTREYDPDMGDYFHIFGQSEANMGQPIQPSVSTNISLSGWVAHGAFVEGGTYTTYENFDPVITRVITDGTGIQSSEPLYQIPAWTPSSWDVINSVRTQGGLQQLMVLIPAQYHSQTGEIGIERVFDTITYTLYYADEDEQDFLPPFIWEIDATRIITTGIVKVIAFDRSDIKRVAVTMTRGDGNWATVDLSLGDNSQWVGEIQDVDNLFFFIQAVDYAGNVSVADNKGNYYFFPYLSFLPFIAR